MVFKCRELTQWPPSQTFYQYLINLIEIYYHDQVFAQKSVELKDIYQVYDQEPFFISDTVFDEYERTLIYEYFTMGLNGAEIAEKKFSNTPNIHKRINKVLEKLRLTY